MTLRVTHVLRRIDGEWRLVHRHADFPPAGPAPVMTHVRAGARRLARRLVLAPGGAAADRGRARGAHPDPDRHRRPHAPRPTRTPVWPTTWPTCVAVLELDDLRDVVLVGHSSGGAVVQGVAQRCPERLRELVHLDSFARAAGAVGDRPAASGPRASTSCGWSTTAAGSSSTPTSRWTAGRSPTPPTGPGCGRACVPHPVRALSDPLPPDPLPDCSRRFVHCTDKPGARQLRRVRRGGPRRSVLAFRHARRRTRRDDHRAARGRGGPGRTGVITRPVRKATLLS